MKINVIAALLFIVSPLMADNISEQKNREFEIEAENYDMGDTQEALKAGRIEAQKQRQREAESARQLEKVKSENQRLKQDVLPQIKKYRQAILDSEAVTRKYQASIQKYDQANSTLKQQVVEAREGAAKAKKEEQDSRQNLESAKKEYQDMVKQKTIYQNQIQRSKKAAEANQRASEAIYKKH